MYEIYAQTHTGHCHTSITDSFIFIDCVYTSSLIAQQFLTNPNGEEARTKIEIIVSKRIFEKRQLKICSCMIKRIRNVIRKRPVKIFNIEASGCLFYSNFKRFDFHITEDSKRMSDKNLTNERRKSRSRSVDTKYLPYLPFYFDFTQPVSEILDWCGLLNYFQIPNLPTLFELLSRWNVTDWKFGVSENARNLCSSLWLFLEDLARSELIKKSENFKYFHSFENLNHLLKFAR